MKIKICTIFLLVFVFTLFAFLRLKINKNQNLYKILKVKNADEYYIDCNKNNKIDDDELFKVKNINAFSPYKNYKTYNFIKYHNIKLDEYLISGFLADRWAKDNLENKFVEIEEVETSLFSNVKFAKIKCNNLDIAQFLLSSGLALLYKNNNDIDYVQLENYRQIKSNVDALKNVDFVLLNKKNNIYHKLNCKYAQLISNGEIILFKDALKYTPCKFCFKDYILKNELKNEISKIPKSKGVYKKSVYKNFNGIELYFINPLEYKKPNSSCTTLICKRIVSEINNSNKTIDVALYQISGQKEILDALINAKKRGVIVRTVLDKSKKNQEYDSKISDLFIEYFSPVRDSFTSIMHNKFMIFDDNKVFTGSANVSSTGTGGYNANVSLFINSNKIAKFYKEEFENMYSGNFSNNKKIVQTSLIQHNNTNISVYFSPKSDVYNNLILKKIVGAKEEIFISIFYLTDKKLINELIKAKNRNVNVLVLIDALGAINFKDRIELLRKANIPVIVENWGGKNHEKTLVIDSKIVIFGSCNFSQSGFYKNDENVVYIENPEIASFYRDYYLYLFNSIDIKFLKYFPRAESLDSINSCYDGIDNNFDGKIDFEDVGCQK